MGIGGKLIQWGKERARDEGVFVGLMTSPMGEGLYRKEGFVEIERLDGGEVGECPVLVWEPEGREGAWVERAKEEEDEEGKAKSDRNQEVSLAPLISDPSSQPTHDGSGGYGNTLSRLEDEVAQERGDTAQGKAEKVHTSDSLSQPIPNGVAEYADTMSKLEDEVAQERGHNVEERTEMSPVKRKWMIIEELERRGQI